MCRFKYLSDSTEDNLTTHLGNIKNTYKYGPGSAETVNFSYLIRAKSKLFTDKRMKKLRVAFFTLLYCYEHLGLSISTKLQSSFFAYREKYVNSYLARRKEIEIPE